MELWEFFVSNFDEVLSLTGEHLWMVFVSISVAAVIGIPAGIVITRKPALEKGILGFANVVQTIPSLALFGFLIPLPVLGGIGSSTAILALILYALLPITRSTYAGIKGVDPSVKEAGRGMGMTDLQLLWQVEIPLALGVILAGIRVAAITSVGIATIAAA
ncbi:MAG: ABC transporter permease, partial [Acidobacteriota bacterium]